MNHSCRVKGRNLGINRATTRDLSVQDEPLQDSNLVHHQEWRTIRLDGFSALYLLTARVNFEVVFTRLSTIVSLKIRMKKHEPGQLKQHMDPIPP